MQAMDKNLERQQLENRVQEIKNFIADNNLEMATKRLVYFAEDFAINENNEKRKNEPIRFRRSYSAFKEDKRKGVYSYEDIERKLSTLTDNVLEFIDLIFDEYNTLHLSESQDIVPTEYQKVSNTEIEKDKSIIDASQTNNKQENINKNHQKIQLETSKEDRLRRKKEKIHKSIDIVVYASNITKQYSREINDFNLSLSELELKFGEITSLVGENGNGKTTLLRIIIGELAQTSGVLKYPALIEPKKHNWYKIKQQIAYIPQDLPEWHGLLVDNLHFAAAIHGIKGEENEKKVDRIISILDLDKYINAKWNEISGGFKMRFSLAKALVWNPKLLVLDEPLANLDVNTQLLFLQDLRYLADSLAYPKAIILSSQHLYEVENITDNIIFIKEGSVLYNGKFSDFGEDREENSFELACSLSKEELTDLLCLEKISYTEIEVIGHHQYIVNTSINIAANDLMKLFIDYNITLKYFRDISKSTRRLFKTEK